MFRQQGSWERQKVEAEEKARLFPKTNKLGQVKGTSKEASLLSNLIENTTSC